MMKIRKKIDVGYHAWTEENNNISIIIVH